jgi:hypothetical protein
MARGLAHAARLTLPDFLGIGAQKAGTTWLHECLRCHPELYLPPQKELHYFDEGFHKSLISYASAFREGRRRIKGEITPDYSVLPDARIRFVRAVMPRLRLVFLLRNPIERAWSQAVMNLVTITGRRFEDVSEAEFVRHIKSERSVRRGDYRRIIANWTKHFPAESLLIGFFEDVRSRPQELLARVLLHIGATVPSDWSGFPINRFFYTGPGKPIPPALRALLEGMYRADIEALHDEFGAAVASWRC